MSVIRLFSASAPPTIIGMPVPESVSLYVDWQMRRERLLRVSLPGELGRSEMLRVLDFLLSRYRDAPEAAHPARFPLHHGLVVERRWIIVHHHLGKGRFAGIQNERESSQRASGILQRMKNLDLQKSVKAPAGGAIIGQAEVTQKETACAPGLSMEPPVLRSAPSGAGSSAARRNWLEINEHIFSGNKWKVYQRTESALEIARDLPLSVVNYLLARLEAKPLDAAIAYELLRLSSGEVVVERVFEAWKETLIVCKPELNERLASIFLLPLWKAPIAEKLRFCLADDNAIIRIHAAKLLARLGTLDDVGLVLDLLSVPPDPDGVPGERDALFAAASTLGGNV